MANGVGKKTNYPGGLTKVRGEVLAVYPVEDSRMTDLSTVHTSGMRLTEKGVLNLIAILAQALVTAKGGPVTITGHRFKNTVTVTTPRKVGD